MWDVIKGSETGLIDSIDYNSTVLTRVVAVLLEHGETTEIRSSRMTNTQISDNMSPDRL